MKTNEKLNNLLDKENEKLFLLEKEMLYSENKHRFLEDVQEIYDSHFFISYNEEENDAFFSEEEKAKVDLLLDEVLEKFNQIEDHNNLSSNLDEIEKLVEFFVDKLDEIQNKFRPEECV